MKLDDVRKLKPGNWIICPDTETRTGYEGTIVHIGTIIFRGKGKDDDFVYVVVHDRATMSSHTWPSNLLK